MQFKTWSLSLILLLVAPVYAISLGDTIDNDSIAKFTTTSQLMQQATKNNTHTEYVIKMAKGEQRVEVNNKNQVYAISWQEKNPELKQMLGVKYLAEFTQAKAQERKVFFHRGMIINTERLYLMQFGLPGGVLRGKMLAKDLAPQE